MGKPVLRLSIYMIAFLIIVELFPMCVFASDRKLIINNNEKVIGVPQIKIDNTVYVSIIPALETLGWEVERKEEYLKFTKDGENSVFVVDVESSQVTLDAKSIILNKPVVVLDNDIYIPSKFVAENFGVQIKWNKKDNLIIVSGYDENNVYVEGEGNIIVVGNGIVVNIFEAYSEDTMYDLTSYADRLLSKNKLEEAIKGYREVLDNINLEDNRDLYVHMLINLGNAYSLMAETKDTVKNTNYAIEYYEKAIEFNSLSDSMDCLGSVLNNLGKAYRILFEINGDKGHLDKALRILEEAYDNERKSSLMESALICHNLGLVYKQMDIIDFANDKLSQGVSLYKEALVLHTLEEEPYLYALIQYNMGNAYRSVAENQCSNIIMKDSKLAYENALEVWSVESFPENYARVHKCLGDLWRMEYNFSKNVECLELALSEYMESLKLFSKDKSNINYPKTNADIAQIYFILSHTDNRYLYNSIFFYNKALTFYYSNNYVVEGKIIALKLTNAYLLCSRKKTLSKG